MDFTHLPLLCGLWQEHKAKALVVRDLGSKYVLATIPAEGELAEIVVRTLSRLFALHGPPLVVKLDGGPGFVAEATRELMEEHGVAALQSPARTPSYNGAVEAGNTWVKRDLEDLALRLEEVLPLAHLLREVQEAGNRTKRPWGAKGPTPAEEWAKRAPVSAEERVSFQAILRAGTKSALEERGVAAEEELGRAQRSALRRSVTRQALVESGYLVIRRSGIPL